jgi:hypothetical protein
MEEGTKLLLVKHYLLRAFYGNISKNRLIQGSIFLIKQNLHVMPVMKVVFSQILY